MSLYAVLGETELEIITWLDGLTMRYAADYAEQGLIGGKSLLQYTGHRPDEVTIEARLHAAWCNPADEVRAIKERMDAREPLAFVLASGEYRGVFVITEAEVTTAQTDGAGRAIAFELRLSLKEYIGDPAEPNPPGVVTAGYRIPVGAATVDDFDLIDAAPVASPGGLAAAVADGIAAIGRAVTVAADVASLASLAARAPDAALLALPGVVGSVTTLATGMPTQAFDTLRSVAQVASDAVTFYGALNTAKSQFEACAGALGSGLSGMSSALYSMRYGLDTLQGARGALDRIGAQAAARLPLDEVWV
ncbi:phage tail protein [Thiobacter aerophilum]|uniref:Phage tail protein n=1 Tax=Thiobacter aerophilum TaxID=3121275 RepID=A0ABV0EDQ3_9BURK